MVHEANNTNHAYDRHEEVLIVHIGLCILNYIAETTVVKKKKHKTYEYLSITVGFCMCNTYSQVLWCECPKASQISPGGGVVELLDLLYQLLLQAPLLLISLRVCKLHHQR